MKVHDQFNAEAIAAVLCRPGAVAVLRTDTIYGVVARAADAVAVRRVYAVKNRSLNKALLLLIADLDALYDAPPAAAARLIAESWPGPISIVIPSPSAPAWLPQVEETLAYRLPDHADLRALLRLTGPLVAPSANPEGQPPAADVAEARAYFGDLVDLYVDGGRAENVRPSRLIRINLDGSQDIFR